MRLISLAGRALFVLAIGSLPLASAVAEGEPDGTWRALPVGTKATYDYGASWEVVEVDGRKVYVAGDRSPQVRDVTWHLYWGLLDSISSSGSEVNFDPADMDKLFPLRPGNKTTLSASAGGWNWKTTYKVTKFKEVDTLLGKRPVFVIVFVESGDGNYKAKGWGYFDAEFGFWHRGSYIFGEDSGNKWKWGLVSLELPE